MTNGADRMIDYNVSDTFFYEVSLTFWEHLENS